MNDVNNEGIKLICDELIEQGNIERTYLRLKKWIIIESSRDVLCPFGMNGVDDKSGRYKRCLCHVYWPELLNVELVSTDCKEDKRILKFCPCKYIYNLKHNQHKLKFLEPLDNLKDYSDIVPHAEALLNELGKRCKFIRFKAMMFRIKKLLLTEICFKKK